MIGGAQWILGGLGLFLLGMTVMTEGLRELAGKSSQRVLARFTTNPWAGAATGTAAAAILQSSSATTVMAVGFVGAGLLTFPQALGVVLGANIGTTFKGWLVALIGIKFPLVELMPPLVFVGALLRMFGRRRLAAAGFALAGFGLVFIGVAGLQEGVAAYRGTLTPTSFPPDTWWGRTELLLIGLLLTIATQSSSAGVATALAAVHVGVLTVAQASAIVVGMDIGTTATAALAAMGGTVDARRTALAHVVYNLLTGVVAFVSIPAYLGAWAALAPGRLQADPEIVLVAFHTLFNVAGALLVLPFAGQFAGLIEHLLPERDVRLTRRLAPRLLRQPHVALANVRSTLVEITAATFGALGELLECGPGPQTVDAATTLEEASGAVGDTRRYMGGLHVEAEDAEGRRSLADSLHVVDHLARLATRSRKEERLQVVLSDRELSGLAAELRGALRGDPADTSWLGQSLQSLDSLWRRLDERIEPYRREVIEATAAGDATAEQTIARLDAIRWLRRVTYHAWRIAYHLSGGPA